MASHEREKSLLPSELFQEGHDISSEDNNNNSNNIMVSPKGLRSFESNFGSCGSSYSSWSDFSSPLSWELGSTSESAESEDDEGLFISELSRQMAEYMLKDDDDDDGIQDHENIVAVSESTQADDSVSWSESKSRTVSNCKSQEFMNKSEIPTSDQIPADDQLRPVEVYELKNQPQMRKQQKGSSGSGHVGRRVESTDSTQLKEQRNMQNKGKGRRHGQGQGKKSNIPLVPSQPVGGSGMRAVFLGGSDRNGSSGTGVFLPSGTYTTPQPRRKSGCSTVLIPARVLQTLQQHFNTVGAMSPSNTSPAASAHRQNDVLARINGLLSQQKEHPEFQIRPAPAPAPAPAPEAAAAAAEINHQQEVQLPQEWTY